MGSYCIQPWVICCTAVYQMGGEAIPGASLQSLEAKRLRMIRAALALCAMHVRTAFTPGACRARMPHDATRLATPNAVAAMHALKAGS